MLTRRQRARRPVSFRSADLLGGASKIVPAGTVVRLPVAPSSLRFAGYNTLSLVANVAGLGGGDALIIGVDTLDPESGTGAALASSLGRATVITATTNGNKAGVLYLPGVIGASPSATYLPNSDITLVGTQWGTNAGTDGHASPFLTTYQNVNTLDDYDSYMTRDNLLQGVYTYKFGLTHVLDPAQMLWRVIWRATKLFGNPINDGVGGGATNFILGLTLSDGTLMQSAPIDPLIITDSWVTHQTTINTVQSLGNPNPDSLAVTLVVQNHLPPTGYFVITYLAVQPLRMIAPLAVPFDNNMIVLDATGSAVDVTVSALRAELTNG